MSASMPASMMARSVTPVGFLRLGRYFRKCTQRSRLTLFEALEPGKRIGGVVDAQVERWPFFVPENQKRRRLPAALVSARGFAGAHRRDQALREGKPFALHIGFRGVVQNACSDQHVSGDGEPIALDVSAPGHAIAAGMSGDAA